jgi:hypothetical protein
MAIDNAFSAEVRAEEWTVKLQEMLDEPTKWKDICRVIYTNSYIIHNPYLTEASVVTGTRGCPYYMQAILVTDEDCTISTYSTVPQFIDRADLAQQNYVDQMSLAERQGILLNEAIESAVYV